MVLVLDWDFVISVFELQSRYYILFRTNTFSALDQIVSLVFFCKDGFGIKKPMEVNMPLNKETKNNQTNHLYIMYFLVAPRNKLFLAEIRRIKIKCPNCF